MVEEDERLIEFNLKRDPKQGYVNNTESKHLFQFNQVFPAEISQEHVFERAAKDVGSDTS